MRDLSYSYYYTWRHWVIAYLLVTIFIFTPVFIAFAALILSTVLGCGDVSEDISPDCSGGSILYGMYVTGWFGLLTFPFGIFLALIVIIANVIWYFTKKSGAEQTF